MVQIDLDPTCIDIQSLMFFSPETFRELCSVESNGLKPKWALKLKVE